MFITLEGPEGAGKSTQLPQLASWLEAQGHEVFVTRNPGGTPIGAQIRQVVLDAANRAMVPTTELMLYAADRAQHVAEVVRPSLDAGMIVLCDRFTDSTMAYQGYGRGLDRALIQQLNAIATGGLQPDLTLLLDLPVEQGLARAAKARQADRLENEQVAFHHRLREGYLALAKAEPGRFAVVDASQDPETVQRQLRDVVASKLGK